MPFSANGLSEMADGLTVNSMSLHSGDPGASGTDNEVTGDGYARQACTFGAASGGVRSLSSAVPFDGPSEQGVSYIGLWDSSTFKGAIQRTTGDAAFNAAGEYEVTTSTQISVAN